MLAPTGPRTPLLRALTAGLALSGALTACGGTGDDGGDAGSPGGTPSADCAVETGVPAPEELTQRLDLGESVTWSVASGRTGSVNASGVATGSSTADLLPTVQAAADAAGWEVFSLDDEGFEAEVLARDAADVLLGVTLREDACPGRVGLTLSITDYTTLD